MIPKKSLFKLSLNHYLKHKIQSILLVLGISLGVAVIVAIDIANISARRSFDKSIKNISGKITHSIYSSTSGLDEDVYFHFRKKLGYKNIIPIIEESVYLKQFPHQEFKIVGIDPFSEDSLLKLFESHEISLNSKAFELFLTGQNGAIISNQLLSRLGLQQGESFFVSFISAQREIKIVGTTESGDQGSLEFSNNILVDIATAQELLDYRGILTRIDLNLESYSKKRIDELKNILELKFPGSYLIRSDSVAKQSNKISKSFELNLTALSLITLLIAFFLIYNSFNYSLVVRRPVFSILRSIGVTSKEVFHLILAEALIIGLISSAVGLVLGMMLGEFSVRLVSNTLSNIYSVFGHSGFILTPISILKAVCIGITAVFSAALIPSLESRFIKPVSLLRNSYFNLSFLRFVPYLFLAGVFLVLTGLYVTYSLVSNIQTTFFGLFLIIIGYTLLLPASMVVLGRILNRSARPFFGKIYLIPCRNYTGSIDKNYIATASLTVAVAVFLSMTILIESFRSTLTVWLENTFASDVFVSVAGRPNENNGLDFSLLQQIGFC
jgi:putative ABC transport system permease protein